MADLSSISRRIWDMKYRARTPDGDPIDRTIEDTWRRVAFALAARETEPGPWAERFYGAMEGFRFIPAGRILAAAGLARETTLFNCFVMGTIPDDLSGIFEHLREAALTLQRGGGIGYDFSTLRPRGARVEKIGADASGPLSFMDVWDAMCRTIMSAGYRRGAMMAVLRCDHPDIEAFVEAKRQPDRLRMFNLSVVVTDAFMKAVEGDRAWDLRFSGAVLRTVPARALWDRIMRATYDAAEPGVIFIDRVNRRNNLRYCETIHATNPCGEQPLPPYGACLLGSLNLARLVRHPFSEGADIDPTEVDRLVSIAVRMLDNAIDASTFPLQAQAQEAKAKRRIGLGITGLGDALILCRARYGSEEAVRLASSWLARLRRSAYLASVDLAVEKGAFPLFDRDAFLAGETVAELDGDVRDAIGRNGIRNALLTSIAPTGTISLLADNVSSGIEPAFRFVYRRHVLAADGTSQIEEVSDPAYRLYREIHGTSAPLPGYFVDTGALTPQDHLIMQAAAQRHVDGAISKTINVPADFPFEDFKDIYREADRLGCKGCTTFRPNAITGTVLEAESTADQQHARLCPKCGQRAVVRQENCDICGNCGYSGCL